MTGRAVVIKTAGNPEIAGAIVDGITQNVTPLNADELAVVKAEYAKLQAAYGVMKPRDDKYWKDKINALDTKYKPEPDGKVKEAITIAWATVWAFIQDWFAYFQRWNREP